MSDMIGGAAKMTGKFAKFYTQLLRDERGQSTVEYILMLSAVVMIAMKFKNAFKDKIDGMVGSVTSDIENGLKNN